MLDLIPVINLHISYLPWNRGVDPNFWSVVDYTPKGVTIHVVDEGIDTGDILLQKKVSINDNHTMRTSYYILQDAAMCLFISNWDKLKNKRICSHEQVGNGSYHKSTDKDKYISGIKDKWLDMTIEEIQSYISDVQMSADYHDCIKRSLFK